MDGPGADVVLLVGSHPPVRSPAAAATMAALRRELGQGHRVVTAAPRPSAASLVLPLAGPTAAYRLRRAREQSGATRLVLAPEPGLPVGPPGGHGPLRDRLTLLLLCRELRHFEGVTLLVSDRSPETARVIRRLGAGPKVQTVEAIEADGPPGVQGVTPLGPPEAPAQRIRAFGAGAGRRLLGPLYTPLRLTAVPLEKAVFLVRKALYLIRQRRKRT